MLFDFLGYDLPSEHGEEKQENVRIR